ncbi:hypothetical protein HYY75_12140 [bacterium]|nr:hypothetical protein [bacterium]
MISAEQRQVIESLVSSGDSNFEGDEFGEAKLNYLDALDEFQRIEKEMGENWLSEDDKALKRAIESSVAKVDAKLSKVHFEWGKAALENLDYERAVDELEEAINLASPDELTFLEEVKHLLDRARVKDREHKIHSEISPSVSRGDDFRSAGNWGEAALEYEEALGGLGGLPSDHRFVTYVNEALQECRRKLVKPYFSRIHRAVTNKKFRQAYEIIQRAQMVLSANDSLYWAFLERLKEQVFPQLSREEIDDFDEADSPELWSTAIKDYEEALNLFSSYNPVDPLSPAYIAGNIYADRFLSSRRNLASLYKKRAQRLRDMVKIERAIKSYKEALKLIPRSDPEFNATFKELKALRAQIPMKTS